ncbi:apses-domain-containing protein [Martensiomyces pterosporus]|nr:apses-domain-containing protein [Martensiomyces pterosporus]
MDEASLANSVYAAVYSSIPVYEMICRGIAVMRRHSDSWLNATQILKVAGVEKGRRTKILEREVLTGEHEKIQGGYGKYQGTWVPFARGVQLCKQYNVYDYIRPILEHDPTESGTRPDRTPTKAEVRKLMKSGQRSSVVRGSNAPSSSAKRARNGSESVAPKRYKVSSSAATSPLNSDIGGVYQQNGLGHGNPSTPVYPHVDGAPASKTVPQTLPMTPLRTALYGSHAVKYGNEVASVPTNASAWGYSSINEDVSSQTMADSDPSTIASNIRVEHDRMLLMNIFLNEDPNYIPDWLSQLDEAAPGSPKSRSEALPADALAGSSVNVDLVIDDQGHTAVHWAAALARIHVLDLLLYQGADARRLNYEGESALVRAVQVTNNYENQTFPDLLELLHDTIPLTDKCNRTVLHHISLAAGIDGRDKAARYYADCLLSWIVRLAGGYQIESGDGLLQDQPSSALNDSARNADFAAFLNLQDVHGNTALNIAARIGDRAMIRMLLNAGASATIANRVGLCPLDFGVDRIACPEGENPLLVSDAVAATDAVWSPASAEQRMHQSVLDIQRLMSELESDFSGEIRIKQEHLDGIKQQLRNTTIELAKARETIHHLHAKTSQLAEIKSRVGYLEETLARETSAVREAIGALPPDSKSRQSLEGLLESLLSSSSADEALASVDGELNLPLIPGGSPHKQGATGDESIAELEKDPAKLLAAVERLRIVNQVYARRDALLRERVAALRKRADASERERQYRQIIASCCEISEADVDVWIDRLVSAVESTGDLDDDGAGLDSGPYNDKTPADNTGYSSLAATTPAVDQVKPSSLST